MDHNLRSEYNSQAPPASTASSIPPTTSTLGPSVSPVVMAAQPQNSLNLSPTQTNPSLALQSSSAACAPQTSISQTQTLSQALSSGPTIPVNTTTSKTQAVPQSGAAATAQPGVENYPHQINGMGGPTATAPFLQDFNLVAEAAKRAQMAVVMRDLESVTL